MHRYRLFLFIFFLCPSVLSGKSHVSTYEVITSDQQQDSIQKLQIIYNGKVWRNLYMRVVDNQFLFSAKFLRGSVIMNGSRFDSLPLLYDIYNDELITPGSTGALIQLNKEMVDSFDLTYALKKYRFEKIAADTVRGFTGYVNILYKGGVTLYLKYRKEIALLEVDDKYDKFYQIKRMYLLKDGEVHLIKNKRSILNLMEDHKQQVKSYIRKNGIHILNKDPDTFIPVVRYYDTLGN